MKAFLYGIALQWKLDLRSKTLLVTCYVVPLLFFLLMGGIFTTLMPEMKETIISSMIVMGVSMGAFTGLPPSLVEIYHSDIKKVYQANGVPSSLGLINTFLSTLLHLIMMSLIIVFTAPLLFEAVLPQSAVSFIATLVLFTTTSITIGCILGLLIKEQAKLTMISQIVFMPSIMLSGIMFPVELLPNFMQAFGKLFPAYWGYRLMLDEGFRWDYMGLMLGMLVLFLIICVYLLHRNKTTS